MVALSLYKGNFHKVPDVPRRWPLPTPQISLRDFKILLHRRARALSRLRRSFSPSSSDEDDATTSSPSSSPSLSPSPNHTNTDPSPADNALDNTDGGNHVDNHCSEPELLPDEDLEEDEGEKEKMRDEEEEKVTDGREDSSRKLMYKTDALMVEEQKNVEIDDKPEIIMNPAGELFVEKQSENVTSDVENRKTEVKEKLAILNEKKHGLVQVLKQILTAEEQLRRQNSTQGRPPLQVDTTTDSGSMSKVNTPRMGLDGNPCYDMEGV